MNVPKRKELFKDNAIYHVYNRGFEKNHIFRYERDYGRFLKTMKKYTEIFSGIKIYSYCLLPNHFHIILHSSNDSSDISDFMRKLQQSYVLYYRNSHLDNVVKWPFFEWRFKAKIIDNKQYLAQCIGYVNYNPLRHGIVDSIDMYKWSSYHQIDTSKIISYKDLILSELEI